MAEEKKGRRVTIDLTPGAAAEVDRMTNITGLTTADVFRYALTVFRFYVDERAKGRQLCIIDPEKPEITTRFELPVPIALTQSK